ncbi:MAG: PD-(D/E)XK nuclease family protein [Gammaproteobacteria bacterium]
MNPNSRCIAHLEGGGLLLAPDLRQARILRRLHDRAQAGVGRKVWPTAQVLPLDTWLLQQWQLASAHRLELASVLSPAALRWLWRRQAERDAPGLLDPAELGARARASGLRLRAYGGGLESLTRWPMTRDQQAFLAWARGVQSELRVRGACDAGDLASLMTETGALPATGPPILLAGFRGLTPAAEALFAALAAAGRPVERLARAPARGACFQHRAADPDSERRDMIAWLRERVIQVPAGIHALILPDLEARRGALERALAAAIQPSLELPQGGDLERVFDLAGGDPLAAQPVVDSALAAIDAAAGIVDWAVASRLLLSPHIADATTERGARVSTELALREAPGQVLVRSVRLAELAARHGAPAFRAAAMAAPAALVGPTRRLAGAWAQAFGASLAAWGWPGDLPPASREYQAARRFRELLIELATLSDVAGALTAAEAQGELRRLAASPFQAESGEPTVFVLDAHEAPGVHLDSLWVAGLTATAWPRPAVVDPLLPIEIQRQLGMPGVTPEGCVAEAREIVACWRDQSDSLVLSWPRIENDTETNGSPLLPREAPPLETRPAAPPRDRLMFDRAEFEAVPESSLPPLAESRVGGGARVLGLQSACPFRAFAELRLGAAPLEEPAAGFDRRLRGIVLHRALQDLWKRLGAREALTALAEPARQALIDAAVDAAIGASRPAGVGQPTLALERDWQRQAVARLLELDASRAPFTVVETERALELEIGGIQLQLRVDRTDRVGDGFVVIDYKTGKAGSGAWRGARMDAPQLPLYAVLHPDRPTGIAFALVGAARARYLGVGQDAGAMPGMKAAEKFALTEEEETGFRWPAITARWRAWLGRLAEDFAAGRTEVDPKLAADTCRHCHLAALCRVEPASPADLEEGAADDR